ncbi:integrase, catalytic region, zinc finger, CCHC-type containing protein [Tanacetum coccineum]
MIHSITHGEQPLPVVAQVSLAGTTPNAPPTLKDPKFWTAEEKKDRKIDLLIRGFEYGEQDRKAAILYKYETFKAPEGEQLHDTYLRYLQVINDLKKCGYKKDNCVLNYKQNQGGVNDAMGYKKKAVVVTLDSLALVDEKTKVNKSKEKVVVQSDSDGSDDEDINDLKNNTALLAKDFNRKKYYAKPMNNNLRTTSASTSANKKPEYVNSEEKKDDGKKRDLSKVKCYNCKKERHFAKDCKKANVKDYNCDNHDLGIFRRIQKVGRDHKEEQFLGKQGLAGERCDSKRCQVDAGGIRLFSRLLLKEDTPSYSAKIRDHIPLDVLAKITKSESTSGTSRSNTQVFVVSMATKFRIKRESAQKKDWVVTKFEELRFPTTKTDGL